MEEKETNGIVSIINEKKNNVIYFIKDNPKQIFILMMVLTILSIIGNFIYYKYSIKNAQGNYKKISQKIFNPIDNETEIKQQQSVFEQAQNVLEMKNDLKRLNDFKYKDKLSKQDSIEIKRLIEKYNLKHETKKINFKQPKYMIPLVTLPFTLYIAYNVNQYNSSDDAEKVEKISTNLGDNDGIEDIFDKQTAYDNAYQMGLDQETAIGGLEDEKDSLAFYKDNLTDAQKRRFDSLENLTKMQSQIEQARNQNQKSYYNPNSNGNNFANYSKQREDQDYDRSLKLLNAINSNYDRSNEKKEKEFSNEYEESPEKWRKEQLKLMREQMIFADSLEKSKDPELQAQSNAQKINSNNFKKKKFYMNSTLKVSKNSKSNKFNSFYKSDDETFIKAIIDENIKGYMGSRLKIRLIEDIFVGNLKIEKGTALFALITGFESQRVKLSIVSVLFKNQILPINLSIYDVDGMEGLYVPSSAFREMSKEMGENIVQGQQLGTGSTDFFNSMLTNIYKSSSQTIAQILRKNKTKIKYNTQIYLIDNAELDKQRDKIYKNNN